MAHNLKEKDTIRIGTRKSLPKLYDILSINGKGVKIRIVESESIPIIMNGSFWIPISALSQGYCSNGVWAFTIQDWFTKIASRKVLLALGGE